MLNVTGNPFFRYQRNIDALSFLMKQQRHHPMEDAVWLLEYISATRGADHLRLASRHLNFFQYHSLDVMAVYGAIFAIFAYVSVKILRCMCCGRSKRKSKLE